jgi:hypothetical protein
VRLVAARGRRPGDAEARKAALVTRFTQALQVASSVSSAMPRSSNACKVPRRASVWRSAAVGISASNCNGFRAIPQYCEFARRISKRIDAECPDIDRETFVEPHEMCSTTHVHNDHRLVTIQEGDMLFWGNVGMQLKMHTRATWS